MYFGSRELSEPFFEETVVSLRLSSPPTPEFETDIRALTDDIWIGSQPVTPACVIVHVTRCGSTLLLNAFRAAQGVVGVGESPSMEEAIRIVSNNSRNQAALGIAAVNSITAMLARHPAGEVRPLVIKCTAYGPRYLKTMRSIWPDVPFLIIVRQPAEVLTSNLIDPPHFLIRGFAAKNGGYYGSVPPEALVNFAAFSSWHIGRYYAEILEGLDSGCTVIDYRNLQPELVLGLGNQFGLSFSCGAIDTVRSIFAVNAKTGAPFTGIGQGRRETAESALVKDSVAQWAIQDYLRLKEFALDPDILAKRWRERK